MSGFRKSYGTYGRIGSNDTSDVGGEDRSTAGKYTSTTSGAQTEKSYIPRLCRSRDPYTAYKSKKEEPEKTPKTDIDKKKPMVNSYLDKKTSALNYTEKKPAINNFTEKKSSLHIYTDKKPVTATYVDRKPSTLSYVDKKSITDSYVEKKPITKSYIDKKQTLDNYIEKKTALDYNRLKVPATKSPKSREASPINTLKFSLNSLSANKYNVYNPSFSERRSTSTLSAASIKSRSKSPQEKDIPKKTDSSTGYGPSYTSYKMFTRGNSFTKPVTVNETSTEKSGPRYGYKTRIANTYYSPRLSESISSVSPLDTREHISYNIENKHKEKSEYSITSEKEMSKSTNKLPESKAPDKCDEEESTSDEDENATRTYVVVTRHTSPTPPGSSLFVRTRRADMAKTEEETVTRLKKKPLMVNKNLQTDDSRSCRFSIARSAPTRAYIDTNTSSNYLGYAGRFSTQYTSGREKTLCNSTSDKSSSIASTNSKKNSENSEQIAQNNSECIDTVSYCIRRPSVKNLDHSCLSKEKENNSTKTSEVESVNNNQSMTSRNSTLRQTVENDSLESIPIKQDNDIEVSSDIVINVNLTLNKTVHPVASPCEKSPSHGSKNTDSTKSTTRSESVESKQESHNIKHQHSKDSTELGSATSLTISSSDDEYGSNSRKTSDTSSTSDDMLCRTSADEISISLDKPLATTSIPEPEESRNKEAKTFLIKALAPITNLFKNRSTDSGDKSISSESTSKDVTNITLETEGSEGKIYSNVEVVKSSSNLNTENLRNSEISGEINRTNKPSSKTSKSIKKGVKKITRIESGERAWWLDSSSKDNDNGKSAFKTPHGKSSSSSSSIGLEFKIPNRDCDEKPWRQDSCANIPEGIERLSPVTKDSSSSSNEIRGKLEFNKLRHIDSGEKEWWHNSNENISKNSDSYSCNEKQFSKNEMKTNSDSKSNLRLKPLRICHVQSGEKAWWLSSSQNVPEGIEKLPPPAPSDSDSTSSESEEFEVYKPVAPPFPLEMDDNNLPLGDRVEPEGLETPSNPITFEKTLPPYNNKANNNYRLRSHHVQKTHRDIFQNTFISQYTDVDDFLGISRMYNPFMDTILARRTTQRLSFDSDCEEIDATEVKIHDSTPQRPIIKKLINRREIIDCSNEDQSTARLTKTSMNTSGETITCRVQYLSDLDPFVEYTPREPARPLYYAFNFTIPLSDQLAGVHRLLRAPQQLDDITLQVVKDGDYGPYLDLDSSLSEQQEEFEGIQDSRKNAIVLRTKLSVRVHSIIERLLEAKGRELRRALFSLKQILQADKDLVHEFVANNGLNCLIHVGTAAENDFLNYVLRALGQILLYVDGMHGVMEHKTCVEWLYSLIGNKFRHVIKTALKLLLVFVEYTEQNSLLLIQAVHAADTAAGQQPWFNIMKILKDFNAADTELLIYAMTLINKCLNGIPDQDTYYDQTDALEEQGIDEIVQLYMSKQGTDLDLLRQFQIYEAVLSHEDGDNTGMALKQLDETIVKAIRHRNNVMSKKSERRKSKRQYNPMDDNKDNNHLHEYNKCVNDRSPIINCTPSPKKVILTPLNKEKNDEERLRKRRERFVRQGHHIIQQQELFSNVRNGLSPVDDHYLKNKFSTIVKINNNKVPENTSKVNINGSNQMYTTGLQQRNGTLVHGVSAKDIASLTMRNQKQTENGSSLTDNKEADDRNVLLNRENTVKDLTQRLSNQNNVQNSPEEKISRVSDMTGLILKAKEGLAKSQSKDIVKSPTVEIVPKIVEIKASENELHWEELRKSLNRNLQLCDLDFTDLRADDDDDVVSSSIYENGIPPPPPPISLFNHTGVVPPPPPRTNVPLPPPSLHIFPNVMNSLPSYNDSNESDTSTIKKNKKTVKLFWKEVKDHPAPESLLNKVGGLIWEDLPKVPIDTKMLEHLFESRTNDLLIKKLTEPKNNMILDAKRSNAINIGMKKLPTPRTIKTAILKMDTTVITREGIEKLLNMQPTEEERIKIQEAQYANPDLPLGSAEQFLLALASITELASRLKLWAFKLDFEFCEKEIAEPLMDLKQGIELLKTNKTFKIILSTIRSVGSFLNGTNVKGFRLEYLSKVMEVKDTVHKHPLLHHICQIIMDKFPDSSDFFSEVGPVIRAAKVDFEEIGHSLVKLEVDCKASWDHLKRVAKHDGQNIMKSKINEFLTDAAERIILLGIIRKRVINRYCKFLLHIGVPLADIPKTKPSDFLKIVSEFALEYRTSRERVLQQLEKKANHRERNKTRGKMIIDTEKYGGVAEITADAALKQLIMTNGDDSHSLSRKKSTGDKSLNGDLNAEDEIFESLVKSTMAKRKPMIPRDRKQARIADRKSLKRSRTRESVPQLDGTSTAS